MSDISTFSFNGANVRTVTLANGEPGFVAKDVADRLGYANHSDAISRHCKGVAFHYPLQTGGGVQQVRVITEPDVLRLIVSSRLPEAEAFERWVFEEVLPAIRKTGRYVAESVPTDTAVGLTLAEIKVHVAEARKLMNGTFDRHTAGVIDSAVQKALLRALAAPATTDRVVMPLIVETIAERSALHIPRHQMRAAEEYVRTHSSQLGCAGEQEFGGTMFVFNETYTNHAEVAGLLRAFLATTAG